MIADRNVKKFKGLHLLPLSMLLLGLAAFFYFRLYDYLNFQTLKTHHDFLLTWAQQHNLLAVAIYISVYIALTAILAPGPVFLTLASGFVFGLWRGILYTDIGATLGAMIIFLAAKTALQDFLYQKTVSHLKYFRQGFQQNAWSYLLFLRLVPLFPFGLVNIVPAFFEVKTSTFFFTTLFGILPGTAVYVWLGSDLGEIFSAGHTPDLNLILQPKILLPILALALLSLIPIIYRRMKRRRKR